MMRDVGCEKEELKHIYGEELIQTQLFYMYWTP